MQHPVLFFNKKILIISPNNWGKIHVSKHHYAIELLSRGNEIYFLEPAISKNKKGFSVRVEEYGINVVTQHIHAFAEYLRFKARWLYNIYCFYFIKKLLKNINQKFDFIWCFETNLYSNLKWFNAKYIIYQPVDLLVYDFQKVIAKNSNIAFSVSEVIVQQLKLFNSKSFFVNHGLNNHFKIIAEASLNLLQNESLKNTNTICVAFVGNLLRPEINRELIISLIKKYPQTTFNFWGPSNLSESNVDGDRSYEVKEFINKLHHASNVNMHGVLGGTELAKKLVENDIMLLPLKYTNNYEGSNSHKIMEYLSTGKVIVSNFISTYSNSNLLEMAASDNLEEIESVFYKVYSNIAFYNSKEKMKQRIIYALDNTYKRQTDKIQDQINKG